MGGSCIVGIEACLIFVSRALRQLGHEPRIIPAWREGLKSRSGLRWRLESCSRFSSDLWLVGLRAGNNFARLALILPAKIQRGWLVLKRTDEGTSLRPDAAAVEASLHYVSDEQPGIRRLRAGKGFRYRDANGKNISDTDTLDRIAHLAIPPAWSDVWISPSDKGHIQATGRDIKGRKQFRYHERWSLCRDEAKFSSLAAFADALPALRAAVDQDLRRRGLPYEKVVASIVWLLDNTMIRVGNVAYARDNKSFGLTTLRSRHVAVNGSKLHFEFKGKFGKALAHPTCRPAHGQDHPPHPGTAGTIALPVHRRGWRAPPARLQDINAYIREACGSDFTSKHFRTWGGTIHAASLFAQTPVPEHKVGATRTMNQVIDAVAARLGNTRAVCRACYIHPRVLESWVDGSLASELAKARRRKVPAGLDEEEATVRHWLVAR